MPFLVFSTKIVTRLYVMLSTAKHSVAERTLEYHLATLS